MSYTTIYKIGNQPEEVGETRNGHRGAMYVWNQIAKDYFGEDRFPIFDQALASKIWNAKSSDGLSDDECIVLASTMDKAVVNHAGITRLIEAFKNYGERQENSSYSEQAELLSNIDISDGDFIAWQQTSCGEFWGDIDWDEEAEETIFYNPNKGDIHFDVISEFNESRQQ